MTASVRQRYSRMMPLPNSAPKSRYLTWNLGKLGHHRHAPFAAGIRKTCVLSACVEEKSSGAGRERRFDIMGRIANQNAAAKV